MKKITAGILVVVAASSLVSVKAQTNPDSLKTTNIQEVVITTALGIKKEEKALGYAVTKVSGENLANAGNQNIVNSLGGKVAGLQVVASGGAPGMASRLVIRGGNKSITGNNEPLYVIDGIVMSNANDGNGNTVTGFGSVNRAADINPNDIADVNVLKGTAAAVLYGSRGSNGVILITTKSGRARAGKPVIEFNSETSFENPLKLPDYQTKYAQGANGKDYAEGTSLSWGPEIKGQIVNSVGAGRAKGLGPQPIPLTVHDPRKDFFNTGITSNNNISLSHSINKTNIFASAGYSDAQSIVPNQNYRKFSFRANANSQVSDRLTVGVNTNYVNSFGNVPFTGQDGNNPIFALFHVPVTWDLNGYGYEVPGTGRQINFRGGSFDNPYWSVYKNSATTKSERYIISANLDYQITEGLKFSYRIGQDELNDDRTIFRDIFSGGAPNGSLTFDNIKRREITSTSLLTYNKDLSDSFNITATVGQDWNRRDFTQTSMAGSALILPGIIAASNIKTFDPGFREVYKRSLAGVFGDLSLSYKNLIFLNVIARNEWSSTLPKDNRSYFYPGANLSVLFSEFIDRENKVLNYGKLRVGYGKTARDASPYQTGTVYSTSFADGFTAGLIYPFDGTIPAYTFGNTFGNPNLKPEFTTEFEVGTDLRFLNNRISLDFSYFQNTNTDGIINLDISPAAGGAGTIINSGKTTSKGIEAALNITPVRNQDFTWNVGFNVSRIRSKVVETYPGVDKIFLGGFSGNPAIFAVKGERLGSIIGTGYAKNEAGQILVDADGYPILEEGKNLGHVEPDLTGGINTSLNYKGFYLTAQADFRMGGYMMNATEQLLDFYGVTAKTLDRGTNFVFAGVNEKGAANDVELTKNRSWYGFITGVDEEYVYKNDWVKLREVTLGYSFKPGIDYVRNISIGVYGRNLYLWSKIPHVDPESSSFGTGNAQGVSRFAFPSTRSFGLNVKLTF